MEQVVAVFSFVIPVVAIIGGISVAIVRILTQARLEELVRKERIAAIERGFDPAKLPALPADGERGYGLGYSRLRRAHGLLIGGLLSIAVGVGIALVLYNQEPQKENWVIGTVPALVGIALLIGSRVVWPEKS